MRSRTQSGEETINAYLTVLAAVQPSAFILENVAGLAYKVHESALELILQTAEGLGYTISSEVINAADYGVPQMRERFFVIGMLDGEFQFPKPTHAKEPGSTPENSGRLPWVTAGEVIGDLDTEENADDTGHFAGGKYHDLLKEIPPGDNYLYFTAKRGHPNPQFEWRKRYWSFLLKLSPDLPSWTIQARRSNNMGPLHWRNRILRIEEVKRLQTFPDDWHLTGTIERQWRQIGNAVPPLLAEALGQALQAQLSELSAMTDKPPDPRPTARLTRLPEANEFSPGQIDLRGMLEAVTANKGDRGEIVEVIREMFFADAATSRAEPQERLEAAAHPCI